MSEYRKVNVAGTDVEYEILHGDNDKPTVVLLHEGLGCVALWRDFPNSLHAATGCSVVAYSRLGYGASDGIDLPRPIEHMRIDGRDFLPQFFAALGIDKPVLLGHSDGATIALEFAIAHPAALKALILLAPHVFVEEISLASIRAIDEQYCRGNLREKLARYHGANVDNAFRGWCDTWLNPAFLDWNMESDLHQILVPILQFQGIDDEYGTIVHAQSIEARTRGATRTCILEDCGHAPHLEHGKRVLSEISQFIGELDA